MLRFFRFTQERRLRLDPANQQIQPRSILSPFRGQIESFRRELYPESSRNRQRLHSTSALHLKGDLARFDPGQAEKRSGINLTIFTATSSLNSVSQTFSRRGP